MQSAVKNSCVFDRTFTSSINYTAADTFLNYLENAEYSIRYLFLGSREFGRFHVPLLDQNHSLCLQEVTLPSNLQTIAYDVFKNCYSLQKVTMPSNLNHIGTSTFENCKNLKEILLPDTLSSIGENAFKGCSVLKAINIPGNVKEIGDSAFEECVSLDEITIPHSIVLGKGVFCSCTALKTVIFFYFIWRCESSAN